MSTLPDDAFTDVNLDPNPSDTAIAAAAVEEAKAAPSTDPEDPKDPADKGDDDASGDADGGKDDGDTQAAADGDDTLRDGTGKRSGGFQGRIDALTARWRDAERRAALAEAQVSARNSSDEGATAEPTPDQFDDYGKYVKALTAWQVDQRARESAAETAKGASEEAGTLKGQIWSTKVDEVKATIPDWDEVVGKSELLLRSDIVNAMMEADRGPEILSHLARNQDVVDRLNEMSPARAAMELAKIEISFGEGAKPKGDEPGGKGPAPEAKPSKAPAPIDPVRPGGSQKVPLDKIDDMDEYVARRKSQGATWA